MTQEKWQEIRNKIYAIAGVVALLLMTVGVIDKAQSDEAVNIVNLVLQLIGEGLTTYGLILAWWKSLPDRVTTIELPSKVVSEVIVTNGAVIAGPANPSPTGAVVMAPDQFNDQDKLF